MFSYMYNNTKGIEIKLNIVCAYMHHHICGVYTYTQEKMNQKPEDRQKREQRCWFGLNKILNVKRRKRNKIIVNK